MFRQKALLLSALLLVSMTLLGQKATITGKVVDGKTSETLIGATVLLNTGVGTTTDFDGSYSLETDPGEYELTIGYLGFESYTEKITLTAGQKITIDVELGGEATLLQTATVTSGKYEKPLGEVTVSLAVMKPDLLESTSKPSIDQFLEKIPGVTMIDGQANIRGGSGFSQGAGSRVLLLMDDVPILQADAGYPNWDDVPIENIEQIEVVKGAASALYGSSALNGIVNVRTAYARAEPETKVSAFYTAYLSPEDENLKWWGDTLQPYQMSATLSHKRKIGKKTDLVLGGFYTNRESYNKDTYKEYGRANLSLRHRMTDRLVFGLNANINYGRAGSFFYWKGSENLFEGTPSTITNRQRNRYNIDPTVTFFDKGENRHRFLGRFYHVNNDNDSNQSNKSNLFYGEYQFQRKHKSIDLVSTAGIVFSGTNVDAELYGDTTFTSQNVAAYLQLDKKFGDRLNLSAGFRYEYNVLNNPGFDYPQGTVAPSREEESLPVMRFGASYKATEGTFVRASIGQGYRFPTVAEKFIFTDVGGFFIVPNPDLTSETGWSAEIGLRQGFKLGSLNGFVDLAAFVMNYQNMMEFNLDNSAFGFRAVNIGDTSTKGWEATLAGKGKIGPVNMQFLTGYTYIDPRFLEFDNSRPGPGEEETVAQINANNSSSEENILKYRSRHSAKFDLEANFKGFTLGYAILYNSNQEAVDAFFNVFLPGIAKFREDHNNGFTVMNARAAFNFTDNLKFSVLMGNITNILYTQRPGLLEAPRNMTVRLDYKF
ncbi:MAG: TonB-dependent receptor [Bacteroidetes bacterium]|nr:MAG: TonB-dependent receptor [Bacteroidota bacterium]